MTRHLSQAKNTNIMNTSVKELVLVAVAKTIKGTSFVSIKNYVNGQGEKSNQLIVIGADMTKIKMHDFQALKDNQKAIFEELNKKFETTYSTETLTKAYTNVYNTLEKTLSDETTKEALRLQGDKTIMRSDAQKDAYEYIATGLKLHTEKQQYYIFGQSVKKKILEAGTYSDKDTKRELTKAQDHIRKFCNFKEIKFRQFVVNKADLTLKGLNLN